MQFGLFYEWPNPTLRNWMMFGGLEHDKLMRSIRLMGKEVIPALRDVHPPANLPDELLHETVTRP